MSETIRDNALLISEGQTLLATIKERIARLEFPDPKNWSRTDRFAYAAIVSGLGVYLKKDELSEQVSLERLVEALLMMVKSGFWWEYDDPGRI